MSSAPQIINILTQSPAFDFIEWEITSPCGKLNYYDNIEKVISCKTKQVFSFDKCKGTAVLSYVESELVEDVISNVFAAGFTGHLIFKIKLTDKGYEKFTNRINFQKLIQNSVQIDLNPFPRNYYQGTNQTDLEPDVVFTSGNSPMELDNEAFVRGFYRGLNEKEAFEGDIKKDKKNDSNQGYIDPTWDSLTGEYFKAVRP